MTSCSLLRNKACQICSHSLARPKVLISTRLLPAPTRAFATTTGLLRPKLHSFEIVADSLNLKDNRRNVSQNRLFASARDDFTNMKPRSVIQQLKSECNILLSGDQVPTEKNTENFLTKCEATAKSLTAEYQNSTSSKNEASSALLAFDKSRLEQIRNGSPQVQELIKCLSELVFSLVCNPNISISHKALHSYVVIQARLSRPETLPQVFRLFAHKSLSSKNTLPKGLSKRRPNIFTNAIPIEVAQIALQSAIEAKKLVVALDIIETAYTTKAFKASKFVRKALLPTSISAIAPFALYSLASQFARWQTSMDPASATKIAFVGMLSYVGLTGTMALVSITTANDQMDRVTWAPGVPLLQRWIREEERAAIDLVACAWGFSDIRRRGEEEGEDWDLIKEWVSRRSMILDRVELMEGMN
ncbi:hypothetical protein K3495_g1388 [Podosphaera aphanis]|nr:hypothetical protein K3495_g1388 [Podosphaera aphanis]